MTPSRDTWLDGGEFLPDIGRMAFSSACSVAEATPRVRLHGCRRLPRSPSVPTPTPSPSPSPSRDNFSVESLYGILESSFSDGSPYPSSLSMPRKSAQIVPQRPCEQGLYSTVPMGTQRGHVAVSGGGIPPLPHSVNAASRHGLSPSSSSHGEETLVALENHFLQEVLKWEISNEDALLDNGASLLCADKEMMMAAMGGGADGAPWEAVSEGDFRTSEVSEIDLPRIQRQLQCTQNRRKMQRVSSAPALSCSLADLSTLNESLFQRRMQHARKVESGGLPGKAMQGVMWSENPWRPCMDMPDLQPSPVVTKSQSGALPGLRDGLESEMEVNPKSAFKHNESNEDLWTCVFGPTREASCVPRSGKRPLEREGLLESCFSAFDSMPSGTRPCTPTGGSNEREERALNATKGESVEDGSLLKKKKKGSMSLEVQLQHLAEEWRGAATMGCLSVASLLRLGDGAALSQRAKK